MSQSDSYQDEMEAELEGLRQELETMQSFAQSSTIPFPSDASYNQEQPSSGRPYRKPISRGIWLLIIGIVPFGVIALIGFMKSNDIKFSQDEPGNTPITLSELALHNTPKDSWVALHGKVYDLTSYAKRHPGGARLVTDLAGMDGTLDYDIFHPVSLLAAVEGDIIGPLVVEEQTGYGGNDDVSDDSEGTETDCENDPTCVTLEELKRHSTAHDCWVAMHGNVYDLTFYANFHPGGSRIVTKLAGTDGTSDYDIFHPIELLQTLRGGELIGRLELSPSGQASATQNPTTRSTPSPTPSPTYFPVPGQTPRPTPDPDAGPSPDPTPGPTPSPTIGGTVTLQELQRHSSADDCWVALHGNVYDLTAYANDHPGGARIITTLAGTDGTSIYGIFHSESLLQTLRNGELIGLLDTDGGATAVQSPTSKPTMGGTCESDTNCITLAQLQRHNTATDCWIAIHGNVYDLTNYANRHPGGAQVITILAGSDGTAAYARFHSGGLLGSLQSGELIGWLEGSTGGNVVTFDGDGWESISDSESED